MSIRLATFCTRYILDHEPSPLDVLGAAAREAEVTRARDPIATVHSAIRHDPRLIELPDGRWECGLRLLEGNVFTHRVRAATSGRNLLFLGVESAPLVVFLEHGPLRLVGGGEATLPTRNRSMWPGPPVVVGPTGWLPERDADDLVGLTWSPAGLVLSTVDIDIEPTESPTDARDERVRTVLARHAPRGVRFDTHPQHVAPLARVIWSALIEVPDLFASPVLPLDEVLDLPPAPWTSPRAAESVYTSDLGRHDPYDRYEFGEPWPDDAWW